MLTAAVSPANATNKVVTWSSSDSRIVKVNAKGVVTGVKAGKATITAKSADKKVSAKCTVTVVKKSAPITLTIGLSTTVCPSGDGIHQDYSVNKAITGETGITLDYVTYDITKFDVLVAGGDLPDIISLLDGSAAQNLIDAGSLLALDNLLDGGI